MHLRPLYAVVLASAAYLSLSAEGCETHLIDDNGFDLWCGDELCTWELERGQVRRVASWHEDDVAVELVGTDAAISQLSTVGVDCIRFDLVADIDENARVILEMDFYDDGAVDHSQVLPTSHWEPLQYLVTPPSLYQGVRFRLRKEGPGRARVAQLAATGAEDCFDKPVEIAGRPVGALCSANGECASGFCDEFLGTCGGCNDHGDCEDGVACGLASETRPFLFLYRQCEHLAQESLGAPCVGDLECSTGVCCSGVCSTCCDSGDCPSDRRCLSADTAADEPLGERAPRLCAPGQGLAASGETCRDDSDCASGICQGDGRVRGCDFDGRVCSADDQCPILGFAEEAHCLDIGERFGTCL